MTSPRRLVPLMRELRAQGYAAPAIGRALGIPESTVRNWWNAGECVDCGVAVEHSNGKVAERCRSCANGHKHETRTWTREAVIDAIQRFAAANGRPPLASEWINVDHANGYPARTYVYCSNDQSRKNPFPKWADAIEAAGFPRPIAGVSPGQTAWSRDLVIDRLRAIADGPLAPAVADAGMNLQKAAKRYCGGWSNAVVDAGLVRVPSPGGATIRERLKRQLAEQAA